MGWKLDKTADELHDFYQEVVRENGPRYLDPRQWHHLWTDFWVAFFDMSYTLGHIASPISALLLLWWGLPKVWGWLM